MLSAIGGHCRIRKPCIQIAKRLRIFVRFNSCLEDMRRVLSICVSCSYSWEKVVGCFFQKVRVSFFFLIFTLSEKYAEFALLQILFTIVYYDFNIFNFNFYNLFCLSRLFLILAFEYFNWFRFSFFFFYWHLSLFVRKNSNVFLLFINFFHQKYQCKIVVVSVWYKNILYQKQVFIITNLKNNLPTNFTRNIVVVASMRIQLKHFD